MKDWRAYPLVAIVFFSVCLCGCSRAVTNEEPSISNLPNLADVVDIEDDIKNRALRDDSDALAVSLTVGRSIQSGSKAGEPLVYPVSLAARSEGGVYISDNNAHRINYYPPNSDEIVSLPAQIGKGQLEWPNTIRLMKDSILVSDNEGIKVFKLDGSFQRLLRIYYQASSFAVDASGNIYGNPHFATQKSSNTLIVKLNSEGTLVKGFGTRIGLSDHFGLDDKAFLCCAGKFLFVVFMHRPEVQMFDTQGTFIREFHLDHSSFDQLARLLVDERFVHPGSGKVRLPQYVAGASVVGDRLLILLDLPKVQIVEFDFEGQELARYSCDYQPFPSVRYRGFDALLIGNTYHFWTIMGSRREHAFAIVEYAGMKRS